MTARGAATHMQRARRLFAELGPGFILAATGIGVGDMVSSTIAGAEYGMTLLWALAAGVALKYAITEGAARWQLATGTTLMEGWRDRLHPVVLAAFIVYFFVWTYVVSSALVAASAMVPAALFPSVPQPVWGLLHAVGAFVVVYRGTYEGFVDLMKGLIAIMFVCVLTACGLILRSGADWAALTRASGFSLPYTLALIGGVGGTVTLISYGYWIREQHWTGPERVRSVRIDLGLSFTLVFLFAASIIFLSTQIAWQGQILEEGPRLCLLLADRIGAETGVVGRLVFLLGFWGAAYSSVLGVWHGVPFLFDDFVRLWRRRPAEGRTGRVYRGYLVYMTLASISTLLLQRPVWLIFLYTVVGSLFFPFVISTLLYLNTREAWVTRRFRNRAAVNVLLGSGLLLYVYLALRALSE